MTPTNRTQVATPGSPSPRKHRRTSMPEPVFTLATEIQVGDTIAYTGRPRALVLRDPEPYTDPFGRTLQAFWCRADDETRREGWVPFGPGGGFPVIKAEDTA